MQYTYINYLGIIYRYPHNSLLGQRMGREKWYNSNASQEIKYDNEGEDITEDEALQIALKYGVKKEDFYSNDAHDE